MQRAARMLQRHVVVEVDSMLLARQMAHHHPWACRSADLIPLQGACMALGQTLTAAGGEWLVRHIYREINQVADALSNAALDGIPGNGPSQHW